MAEALGTSQHHMRVCQAQSCVTLSHPVPALSGLQLRQHDGPGPTSGGHRAGPQSCGRGSRFENGLHVSASPGWLTVTLPAGK